ncbi:sugar transferase [Arthrobacter psychrochitiniphilus]|uniref:sugar transferase n=1 Tax=Arthrobacter psychrochitiniphilus TaxID=291045 RepID=UPI003F7BEAC9
MSAKAVESGRYSWSREYIWKLRATDAALTLLVMAAAFVVRWGADLTPGRHSVAEGWYLGLCAFGLIFWNIDLEYSRSRERKLLGIGVGEYRRTARATFRTFGALAILMVIFGVAVPRVFFAIALPLGVAALITNRWLWRRWLGRQRAAGKLFSTVVVVGSSQEAHNVVEQLRGNLGVGYKVGGVALTTLTPAMQDQAPWNQMPVLSNICDIDAVVAACGAEVVLVAGELPGGSSAIQELGWRLGDLDMELVLASSLTNIAGPRVHFRPVEGLPMIHVEVPHYSGGRHAIKRGMDIALAATALLLLLPLMLTLAVIVKFDSNGPALFFQQRVGKNGELFRLYKFRSMVADAEAKQGALLEQNQGAGVLFKIPGDPRVTRCGRWMRKYSLDELPQLWNVLLGNMSLVGPRPPLTSEVAKYETPTRRRLLIKPGITGLWQISGRSDLPWEEAVRLDLYYVENWSLTGDIIILWRTVKVVVEPVGAY